MKLNKPPTEHLEQVSFVNAFRKRYPEIRIFAIPNGGFRHKATAVKLKAEGAVSGVPDLYVPAARLWIEFKRVKGGRVSPEQKDWIDYLNSIGDTAIVVKGWGHAKESVFPIIDNLVGEL